MSTLDAVEKDIKNVGNPTPEASAAIQRRNLIQYMDPGLKAIYEQELKAYQGHVEDNLTFNYERGCVASEVQRSPNGDQSVDILTKALDLDKSTVYKTITFSSMYTSVDHLNIVINRAKEAGFALTWSHYAAVVHIKEAEGVDPHSNRRKMIDRAISDKLSVRALAAVVKEEFASVREAKPVSDNRGTQVTALIKKVDDANIRFQRMLTSSINDLLTDITEVAGKIDNPADLLKGIEDMNANLLTLSAVLKRVLVYTSNFTPITLKAMEARAKMKKTVMTTESDEGIVSSSKPKKPSSIENKVKL